MSDHVLQTIGAALQARRGLGYEEARTMPSAFYTSQAFLALEREQLFKREWICVGRVDEVSLKLGRRLKALIGKPGLDGHSSGAEQIAIFARDAGIEVVYEGIRVTADELVASAEQEGVHLVGLSILSGSHLTLVPEIARRVRVPVVVGGIIPDEDAERLRAQGVAAVYTPRDYDVTRVIAEMVELVARAHGLG